MDEEPLVRVLRGDPAPEELAALVSVLAGGSTSRVSHSSRAGVSNWSRSALPGAVARSWRASGLPRRAL
jgi:hypothetical protein